jgi:transposase InsO family protein
MKFAFIDVEKASFPIRWMCRRLEVSSSGFYAWRKRPRSAHARRDIELGAKVAEVFAEFRGTYGAPRVADELRKRDESTSIKRVARLLCEQGLSAKAPRRFTRTTDSSHALPIAENVLERHFDAEAPNTAWVTDISYVSTWEGWIYLAVVIDLFSRRVVGWAVAEHMRTELALDALAQALTQRQPAAGLVHHSDRGVQYASRDYQRALDDMSAICSMSRKGNCWDNAVAESFFATLKRELLYRESWPTRARAKAAINEYIACFYNSKRAHSALGNFSPIDYELAAHREAMKVA